MEFFAPLFHRRRARDYATALAGLQDELGRGNDAATAARLAVQVRERGDGEAAAALDAWLAETLEGAPGAETLGDVLARHGSAAWSRDAGGGRALLRLPQGEPLALVVRQLRHDFPPIARCNLDRKPNLWGPCSATEYGGKPIGAAGGEQHMM